jgi:CheY-like chemotaxis protein
MQTSLKPQSKTILYIDDDEDDKELIAGIIKELDDSYNVINASNGEEALRLLKQAQHLPCLVLLDINMPVMDGKETLQKIREQDHLSNIPIVVFTTSTNPADQHFFSKYGVKVHTKPDKFQSAVKEIRGFLSYCN